MVVEVSILTLSAPCTVTMEIPSDEGSGYEECGDVRIMMPAMLVSKPAPLLIISGAAGTGKTTVANAWAAMTGARVLDLDIVAADLVRRLHAASPGSSEPEVLRSARRGRYECLVRAIVQARESQETAVVAVAPFTEEISSARAWSRFVDACGSGEVALVWLWLDEAERARRIEERGATRDRGRDDADKRFAPPEVAHLAVSAAAATDEQIAQLRSQLGNGPFI